jgi:hypothetical protein
MRQTSQWQTFEGRKTSGRKAASAKNALKHGLLSRELLQPDEDAAAFSQFSKCLGKAIDPVGELELVLANRIVGLAWRLQRLGKLKEGILAWQWAGVMLGRAEKKKRRDEDEKMEDSIISPKSKDCTWLEQSRSEKYQLEDAQRTALATSGVIFLNDASGTNELAKLSRYETSMERSFYKTLHEFQRLQAARQGKAIAPPLLVEIDVSGAGPREIDFNVLDLSAINAAD